MRTPIESLLNIKRWNEDEAKNRFALLLKELASEEGRLRDLEEQYRSLGKKIESGMDELVNIDDIKKLNQYLENTLIRIHRQKKTIAEKERTVEDARICLVEASREKKVFERLDEKNKAVLEKEHARKEQIRTDEHAVTGHHRKKKA
jgi:flagellar FliJ protein